MTKHTFEVHIPRKQPIAVYYHDVIDAIEKEHGYQVRGFNGTHNEDGTKGHTEKYLDFWHYLLSEQGWEDEVSSDGSYVDIYRFAEDYDEDRPAWAELIIKDIFEAVGADHPAYDAKFNCITFYVSW